MPLNRTPQQVADRTGIAGVTDANIATARGIIAAEVGYDLSADDLPKFRARDLRLVTEAVDWQAAYVKDHPDLLSRDGNLASASTNGNAVSWGPGGAAGSIVAPLAAMSLRRLSWRRSRSVPMRRVADRPLPQTLTNDGNDAEWKPLR